ncbi:MAG: radical SAM protein, partial [Nitrospirae bacterium]|nr:radical SAM protein [Nitrospirota bacterium]
ACNIQCRYCIRKYDCSNESRPGVTSKVLTPYEAYERVKHISGRDNHISVIGIAGPGDPLANEATFETLELINKEFPELILCLSTNGLLLIDKLKDLLRVGVKSLTITINAVTTETAEKIYSKVCYSGYCLDNHEGVRLLLKNQWTGLTLAIEAGLIVKVNTVYIPGINDGEIPLIAHDAGKAGANIMNIIPLYPQAEFIHIERPSHEMLNNMRAISRQYIPQMTHCRQCRADALGVLGEDRDMETEMLYSILGEEQYDRVC